jgi:AraC family transcriptional regulator of adaptative response/methylated-DNA-[protein]-cysteine methyltransferase
MLKQKYFSNKDILHNEFIKIIPIPKTDWKKEIIISYSFFSSSFGKIIVASMPQGICFLGYAISHENGLQELRKRFPKGILQHQINKQHKHVKKLFTGNWEKGEKLLLYVKGTSFQIKVWKELLKIPTGYLSTYSKIAISMGCSKAQRAVGTAIGRNPALYIIPCHRVIAQNGKLGGFYWGIEKKIELLNAENANYLVIP